MAKSRWLGLLLLLATVQAGSAGTIKGVVKASLAKIPRPEPVKMAADPDCMAKHQEEILSDALLADAGKNLKNAFVYIKAGLEGKTYSSPEEPVVLNQKGCMYLPHVSGMMAGQPLRLLNSDGILHNVHMEAKANKGFNRAMPASMGQMTAPGKIFALPEIMVAFKCDVHPWMKAYVGIVPHPFYAVSAGDGTYELKEVPPGTYEVEAWHEALGAKTQKVQVGEGVATLHFALGGSE